MTETYGWAGRILWVDLSNRKTSTVATSDFEPEKFIGGVGLNSKIFWEMGCPEANGMHPDSPLFLSVGPLTGTSGPFARATVSGTAPQGYPVERFAYSGFGGKFPSQLKYAGYDGIVITGASESPAYLSIRDSKVEIRDAGHVWGMDTFSTQKALAKGDPKASVFAIGPAGENLSRMAIIITETSGAAGQGGYGAVMGAKKLKAIVARGTGTVRIAKPDEFAELINQRKAAGDWVAGPSQTWGRYPLASPHIVEEMKSKYLKKISGCFSCPYQCHGVYDMPGAGRGAQLCTDIWYYYATQPAWKGSLLAQKLGINTFDLVALMSFLGHAAQSGLVTETDIGASWFQVLSLSGRDRYTNHESHHRFVEEITAGIADGTSIFSQGMARAAEQLGKEAMDLFDEISPAWGNRFHHIRGVAEALHWATDTRDPFNSCHDHNAFGNFEKVAAWFGLPGGYLEREAERKHRRIYTDAEKATAWVQNHQCLKNSLLICEWASLPAVYFHPPEMDIRIFESKMLRAVTGLNLDPDELWQTGERIWNLRRSIMVLREGRHRNEDTLSPALFRAASRFPEGMSGPLDRTEWESLKDRYYALRGWDVDTGRPTGTTLERLGMAEVAGKLEETDCIGKG